SSAARPRWATRSSASACARPRRRSSPGSRCSGSRWTSAWPATTWAFCCAASRRTTASAGWAYVGRLLGGIEKDDLERGMVIAAPKSVKPHTKFKGEVYILTKEEGGRHTPFFDGYRPQFYFRTTDVTGVAKLPEGREMVMPGDNVTMEIELITPIAMDKELRFAIREGGRTVGAGVVAEVSA